MNAKVLEKHYARLTPRERAVLTLNAFGRKDEREVTRLIDAAPRVTLDAPDCGRELQRLAHAIECHALAQAEQAATLFFFTSLGDRTRNKHPDLDDPYTIEILAHNIVTRADGWRLFCDELGLDPVGALRITGADTLLSEMAESIARAITTDLDSLRAKMREQVQQAEAKLRTPEEIAADYRQFLMIARDPR